MMQKHAKSIYILVYASVRTCDDPLETYWDKKHFHCVCEQLCPWQDCTDVQARLSLRWPHVQEVTSHELIRFVKHDKNILVCASVRTCDDPLESFNVFNLLPHNTVS